VTLDNTAIAGNSYKITVAITNNEGILPNPLIFHVRVNVSP